MKKFLSAVALVYCFLMTACEKETIIETIIKTDTLTVTVKDTVTLTRTINLDSGLIAYYPFNGNANDESGNNKHGVLMNGTGFNTNVKNSPNKAANFDGYDDYIRITDQNNYFAPPKMSASFLINFRNVAGRSSIMSKSAFTTSTALSWGIDLTNNVASYTVADASASCSALWYYNPGIAIQSTSPFQNNTWYHLAIIFNQGVEMMYVNGNLISAKVNSFSTLNQCPNADFKIGGWWQNDIVSIQGKLDEVRIYDRILSEAEIKKLATEIY